MADIYLFCPDEQYQPEEILSQAILAERVGFDGIMISEHFHPWVDDYGSAGFAFSLLGAIAAETSKIKLMTSVTTPLFRFHPAVIAQAAATISRLSGGRFSLGIGTGENINEMPLGFSLPPYLERAERMEEAVEIMRRLLDGETLTFKGKYYQTDAAKLYSPPIGRLNIYMAAGGEKSAAFAGKHCDGVIVSAKDIEKTLKEVIEPFKKTAGKRSVKVVAMRWSVFAGDDDEAWQALLSQRGLRTPIRGDYGDPAKLRQAADQMSHEEVLSAFARINKIEDYLDEYYPLASKLKADIVGIQTTSINQAETIKQLAKHVVPELKRI